MLIISDHDLVVRVLQGDHESFALVVRRYQGVVFNVAYRLVGNRADAEDMAQEAFWRAFRALASFDAERPLAPWLKKITTNVCLNWLESQRARPQIVASDLFLADEEYDALDKLPDPAPPPEQHLAGREQEQRLRSALIQLPPRYRVMIELRHYQDLSYEEMAELLQVPLSTVKSDLFRARKLLEKQLQ
ncbi:MAG: sigma-70 family RNA polymerase sigma factor [Chloroflexi bacterium]|nr:sigma-70 family RNA polymerase sigma factor [Chloroflexota bacterium]MBP8056509.1 sigma-70 family RNA polymerase sigma factor [Chloroflexota bacterium]